MYRIIGIVLSIFLASGMYAQSGIANEPLTIDESSSTGPALTFETTEVDYGVIEQNSEPYRSFNFTNTGDAPLIITNAKGSCGCTVPEYPKEPIAMGESNVIKVRYATNRIGKFTKTVTLTTNEIDAKQHVITIKGEVLKPLAEENTPVSTLAKKSDASIPPKK